MPEYCGDGEDTWATREYLDELFVQIQGRQQYLWRTVDQDGDVIDILVQSRAIEEPIRWIATHAGHEGSIVVQKVQDMKDEEGFNAQAETYENLVQAGVIDPAQGGPLRTAARGVNRVVACSRPKRSSGIPEQNKDAAMPGGGMGADMY